MKATEMEDNSEAKPLAQIERHSYSEVGWISRQKSSRPPVEGRNFLLTSLFIELIDQVVNVIAYYQQSLFSGVGAW